MELPPPSPHASAVFLWEPDFDLVVRESVAHTRLDLPQRAPLHIPVHRHTQPRAAQQHASSEVCQHNKMFDETPVGSTASRCTPTPHWIPSLPVHSTSTNNRTIGFRQHNSALTTHLFCLMRAAVSRAERMVEVQTLMDPPVSILHTHTRKGSSSSSSSNNVTAARREVSQGR